jgi:hypothetical protein
VGVREISWIGRLLIVTGSVRKCKGKRGWQRGNYDIKWDKWAFSLISFPSRRNFEMTAQWAIEWPNVRSRSI